MARANAFWPTAVVGEADSVNSVSASACHIGGPKGVSPGQKALLHGNKFCFNFNKHHPFYQMNFPCWALLLTNLSQNLVFCQRVPLFYSLERSTNWQKFLKGPLKYQRFGSKGAIRNKVFFPNLVVFPRIFLEPVQNPGGAAAPPAPPATPPLLSLDPKMDCSVVTQHCCLAGKSLTTYWTFVRFLSSVNIHVVF